MRAPMELHQPNTDPTPAKPTSSVEPSRGDTHLHAKLLLHRCFGRGLEAACRLAAQRCIGALAHLHGSRCGWKQTGEDEEVQGGKEDWCMAGRLWL